MLSHLELEIRIISVTASIKLKVCRVYFLSYSEHRFLFQITELRSTLGYQGLKNTNVFFSKSFLKEVQLSGESGEVFVNVRPYNST